MLLLAGRSFGVHRGKVFVGTLVSLPGEAAEHLHDCT